MTFNQALPFLFLILVGFIVLTLIVRMRKSSALLLILLSAGGTGAIACADHLAVGMLSQA